MKNFLKKNFVVIMVVLVGVIFYYTSFAGLRTDVNNLITPAEVEETTEPA